MNLSDIWGAVDKPKRKRPDVVSSEHEQSWITYHMRILHEWVTENLNSEDGTDICRTLSCGGSELDDIVDNVTNHFTLARIKQIHINLNDAKAAGNA